MKILFFVDRLLHGGIQTLLLNLTIELQKTHPEIQIDFLNFDDGNTYDLEDVMKRRGCEIYKVPMPHFKSLHQTLSGLNKFFKTHHDYDLIHAHCSSKGAFPLFYAKKYGIHIRIAHSHCTKFQSQNPFIIWVGNIMKVPLCQIATDYFACSKLAGEWLFGNFFAKKNLDVNILKNGIILDKFLYDPIVRQNLRKDLNISNSAVVIGHVGRFSHQKNHRYIIDIFRAYHTINFNSKLLLVGVGELKTETERYVSELHLENDVLFVGFHTDTYRFYQAMDLFLMPSLYEGLPFVGIEAQTADLPCLFSDTISEEVKILDSSLFMSLDTSPNEWANSIQKMIENRKRKNVYSRITDAGYNIKIEAAKLYHYYEQAITTNHNE